MHHDNTLIKRVIDWSFRHRLLVLLFSLALLAWGVWSLGEMKIDAIPDLSDAQVIVKTSYPGQSPDIVEDQVTYPLTSAFLSVPGSTAVRGFSMYGESYVYIIFKDGTDPYWARSRVLEYLNQISSKLPQGVTPALGPDASGVGWVFEYALRDRHHRYDQDQLRTLQDYYLKYELQSLPGVAEVASVGGMVRQFQIEIDPNRLAAYRISTEQVAKAVRDSNSAAGGAVIEMGRSEYMVRERGYLKSLADFSNIAVGLGENGVPVLLRDVAHIGIGGEARRGVTDLDGEGEATGGIVVMRYGANALDTIKAVKQRLAEIRTGLPEGVEVVVTYDRSGLIKDAVHTLKSKLIEESLVVALVCLIFLLHFRSSLVAIATLPVGILAAFAVMNMQGVSANIMSLGGIAIAIGAMIDAAIVMIENMHKHLEREHANRWQAARVAAHEVGPALFFSLLIIMVSFFPVFALTGQEGKIFTPLAYTKTYAMAAAALLAITLTPVLMGYLVRGKIRTERQNPLNRALQAVYQPVLNLALNHRKTTLALALLLLLSAFWPAGKTGSEFMPPLYEGDLLYMPTTLPGVSIDEAANILQITDRLIRSMPEVERVYGKAGRADTALDPAPLSMFETVIRLKPKSAWPAGETTDELIKKLDSTVSLPGLTHSWGYPIRTRIDMLSTGIRTPLGLKITGTDAMEISALAQQIETVLRAIRGTRSVFAERIEGGHYLDIEVDRRQAARYGITVAAVEQMIEGAVGGKSISSMVAGRERYTINLRYQRAFRDSVAALSQSRVMMPNGDSVTLGSLARISFHDGPTEIKSENGRLVGYVYINTEGRDLGGYVEEAKELIAKSFRAKPGYAIAWSGQYANLEHARARLTLLIPLTLLLVFALLYFHFRDFGKVLLVLLCLPFSLVGGVWFIYLLGYPVSVAVVVGFIALAGVATEFGVVMLLYLDKTIASFRLEGKLTDARMLREAIMQGAVQRLRPKLMTVSVIIAGLLPVMFGDETGTDVMKRIAAPLIGGMVTAPLLSLIIIPVVYLWWQEIVLKTQQRMPGKTTSHKEAEKT
jgi:Cu(I)/Ag(I) efflux system membrane protein CusA/SilA